jgi:hypothetical protein
MTGKDRKKGPLEPHSDNPSLNSMLRAATQIQSEVQPEDYPEDQRGALGLETPGKPRKSLTRKGKA